MIFDKTFDALSTTLDLCLIRQAVISDNIANAETPGYKARRVEFEAELQRAIASVDQGLEDKMPVVRPAILEDPENEVGQDLNTVDMDREMAVLSKNDVKYSAVTQSITKKFGLLKYAISGGGEM